MDEFPYLVEQSSELPSVLQKLVDEKQLTRSTLPAGAFFIQVVVLLDLVVLVCVLTIMTSRCLLYTSRCV